MVSASPFHCDSGYVTSDALTTTLTASKFVPFSPTSSRSSSSFTAPPVVILGARYAGVWPRQSSTPMRPRGGGASGGTVGIGGTWLAAGGGLSPWFGGGGLLNRVVGDGSTSADADDGRRPINYGVWIEGRPSTKGFIVAFQTGNPDPDARISANWMACGN